MSTVPAKHRVKHQRSASNYEIMNKRILSSLPPQYLFAQSNLPASFKKYSNHKMKKSKSNPNPSKKPIKPKRNVRKFKMNGRPQPTPPPILKASSTSPAPSLSSNHSSILLESNPLAELPTRQHANSICVSMPQPITRSHASIFEQKRKMRKIQTRKKSNSLTSLPEMKKKEEMQSKKSADRKLFQPLKNILDSIRKMDKNFDKHKNNNNKINIKLFNDNDGIECPKCHSISFDIKKCDECNAIIEIEKKKEEKIDDVSIKKVIKNELHKEIISILMDNQNKNTQWHMTILQYKKAFEMSFKTIANTPEILWTIREFLDALNEYIIKKYENELLHKVNKIKKRQKNNINDEDDDVDVYDIIENSISSIILQPKAKDILLVCQNRTKRKSLKLYQNCLKLKNKNKSYFGINKKHQDNNFIDAIESLKRVKKCLLPYDKLLALQKTATNIHKTSKNGIGLDADNFMSICIYVFVQATQIKKNSPPISFGESLFMQGLIARKQSQMNYYLCTFVSVIKWIYNHKLIH